MATGSIYGYDTCARDIDDVYDGRDLVVDDTDTGFMLEKMKNGKMMMRYCEMECKRMADEEKVEWLMRLYLIKQTRCWNRK